MSQFENILNWDGFSERDLDTPVYRIFSFEKFITSLNDNSLYFANPKHFDDPYDCFLLTNKKRIASETLPSFFTFNFLIQSWTLKSNSNLMWSAYAPNKNGILIETTIGKLQEFALRMADGNDCVHLGKVIYLNETEFNSKYIVPFKSKAASEDEIFKSLFIKRKAFEDECEFRLVLMKVNSNADVIKSSRLGFNLAQFDLFNELANKVVLDPRMDRSLVQGITQLLNKNGIKASITQSTLYKMPEF